MKRRLGLIWVMVLAMALTGMCAHAMPLKFSDEPLAVTAAQVSDGEAYDLEAEEIQLLGKDEDGDYLIFADGRFLKADADALADALRAIGAAADSLPAITDYQPLARRDTGDEVVKLQNTLIALGYMEGEADGNYGSQSRRAVEAFQRELGLEETGEADPLLQMLMDSMQAEALDASKSADPAVQFAAISGKTEANLDAAVDLGLTLDYDDVAGIGMITRGAPIAYDVPAESDIDKRAFALSFGLGVRQDEDGEIEVAPVLEVVCTGVQRPVMEEIILKSGDERHNLAVTSLDDGLSGLMAVETTRLPLDDETVEMLANAADEGELKIRVGCRYGDYDIPLTRDELKNIALIGEAALGLDD